MVKSSFSIVAFLLSALAPAMADSQRLWVGGWGNIILPLISSSGDADAFAERVKALPGQTVHFYAANGQRADLEVKQIETETNCGTMLSLSGALPSGNEFFLGSTTATTPVAKLKLINASDPALAIGVSTYLRTVGVQSPKVAIMRVLEADLDGDGTAEVLVEATTSGRNVGPRDLPDAPGDFSVVVVGEWSGKALKVISHKGYIFGGRVLPGRFGIVELPDFRGIGHFDVAVSQSGYEWAGIDVYAWSGRSLTRLASAFCGL